jgi:2-polyprenyl-3-methyl-5-hydroxy-6-metoxy-1,4-benzoquinol methylase
MKLKSKQQKQTKNFFEKNSRDWQISASLKSNNILNIIKQRNQYVTDIAKSKIPKGKNILDVACGSGELVIGLTKLGFKTEGIDFSKSMIRIAKQQANKNKISKDIFINESFFDYEFKNKYDLIAANGFIEYISENELKKFLLKCHNLLKKNGIIVFGSRNRLFNVFSFSKYTNDELKINSLDSLVKECIIFNSGKNLKYILKNKEKLQIKTNLKKHSKTGINVESRFQYTPFQLIDKLKINNFKPFDVAPIHIHILSTESRKKYPNLHNQISNYIQNQKKSNLELIPQASSFMISARKK